MLKRGFQLEKYLFIVRKMGKIEKITEFLAIIQNWKLKNILFENKKCLFYRILLE